MMLFKIHWKDSIQTCTLEDIVTYDYYRVIIKIALANKLFIEVYNE